MNTLKRDCYDHIDKTGGSYASTDASAGFIRLSDDLDAPDELSGSPVQLHYYSTKQEGVVWALIIVLVVISLVALYLLWVKASGNL